MVWDEKEREGKEAKRREVNGRKEKEKGKEIGNGMEMMGRRRKEK